HAVGLAHHLECCRHRHGLERALSGGLPGGVAVCGGGHAAVDQRAHVVDEIADQLLGVATRLAVADSAPVTIGVAVTIPATLSLAVPAPIAIPGLAGLAVTIAVADLVRRGLVIALAAAGRQSAPEHRQQQDTRSHGATLPLAEL